MKTIEEIRQMFRDHSGIIKTSDFYNLGMNHIQIQKLLSDEVITKVKRGYYQLSDQEASEAGMIMRLFPDAVFCMDTALFFYHYSDRTPLQWHITVDRDSSKSRFKIDYPFVRPHFVEKKLLEIGAVLSEMDGSPVRIYDRERTICDCLKHKNKMDKEIFNKALQNYIKDPKKNIKNLTEYAQKLGVYKKVEDLIGVWL